MKPQSHKTYTKMTSLYAPTLKEDPAEAELASHKLLLRAGFIRKSASGLYSYLPLAWKTIAKIEEIIREEMAAIDAQEMQVPILTDAELWHQSHRWDAYGPELMRLTDRHEREFALGPTHEESFTDLVRSELRSYKQLPVTLYQIQDKFRDELRPRFGLMRGREFIMKDGYSFSASKESLQECYDQEKEAYAKICERCGIKALPVAADSGQIGGDTSVEFMALAEAGEASLVYCDDCGYAADTEAASAHVPFVKSAFEMAGDKAVKIDTPNCQTIADLAAFLEVPAVNLSKALALVDGEGAPVVVFVPGDHELNEVKAEHAFGAYHLMTDDELKEYGLCKGYIGPLGLPAGIKLFADVSLLELPTWISGANKEGAHYRGLVIGRDFEVDALVDVITAAAGDRCPHCGASLQAARGIECGQVFQLGTKYSEAMGATFTDVNGKEKPFEMGCYGIGVSRTMAASVEQHHDEHGIIWPVSIAPFEVSVISLDVNDELVWPAAQKIASELAAADVDVVLDDRKERPGVKFADADLMGFPYQVVCGKKALAAGNCEVKVRATGERLELSLDEVVHYLVNEIKTALSCEHQ